MTKETDDEIEARLAALSNDEVLAICESVEDASIETREQLLAHGECERRGIDF